MSTRKLEFTLSLRTTPEQLWKELTEAERITRWFAPDVQVVPGEGGSIRMAWGDMAGEAKIEVWEPGKHLRTSFGPQAVDYYIESNETGTILRLVQSGFSTDASFDDEYESSKGGWTNFLAMLRHSLERHPQTPATTISFTRPTGLSPADAYHALDATGEWTGGTPVVSQAPSYACFVQPALNDSMIAVFCEGKAGAMVTMTAVLYGLSETRIAQLRERWTALFAQLFAQPV